MAGLDDELIAVTLRGELRPDERVDLVYLDAPGALAERQAALPVVGVNDGYTERLDVGSRERISPERRILQSRESCGARSGRGD